MRPWYGCSSSPLVPPRAHGLSIILLDEVDILYEVDIAPGLMAMIQLFNGPQSPLSMVYDREMGNMRTLPAALAAAYGFSCPAASGGNRGLRCSRCMPSADRWFWDIALLLAGLIHRRCGAGPVRPDARRVGNVLLLRHQGSLRTLPR